MAEMIDKFDKMISWIKRDKDGKWTVSFGLKDYIIVWATLLGGATLNQVANALVLLRSLIGA